MSITDLWLLLPTWLFRRLVRWLKINEEELHETLCDALGCRCES